MCRLDGKCGVTESSSEITAHTCTPSEARLTEMAATWGVTLHELKPLEVKWGYIPHRMVVEGEAEALSVFSEALLSCDLRVGQLSVWDGV